MQAQTDSAQEALLTEEGQPAQGKGSATQTYFIPGPVTSFWKKKKKKE